MKTNKIFPKGKKADANFTGDAWVEMLSADVATFDAMTYNVTFAPAVEITGTYTPVVKYCFALLAKDIIRKKGNRLNI